MDEYVRKYKQQILEGDRSLPSEMQPTVMYHCTCQNAWDSWENVKYIEQMREQNKFWCRVVSKVLREEKLQRKRAAGKNYCKKVRQ